jgi:hypothetical protein
MQKENFKTTMLICTAISKYPKQADLLNTLLAYTKNTVSHIPSKLSPQTYIVKHQFHSVSQVITRFQLLLSQEKKITIKRDTLMDKASESERNMRAKI